MQRTRLVQPSGRPTDEELAELIDLVHGDLLHAISSARAALGSETDQLARRAYVRTAFAAIEGSLSAVAMFFADAFGDVLADGSRVRLEDGRTEAGAFRSLRERTKDLVRIARPFLAEPIDLGGQGFKNFRDAIMTRDRLMHPKRPADLVVSDEDVHAAQDGVEWVRNAMEVILGAAAKRIEESVNDGSSSKR